MVVLIKQMRKPKKRVRCPNWHMASQQRNRDLNHSGWHTIKPIRNLPWDFTSGKGGNSLPTPGMRRTEVNSAAVGDQGSTLEEKATLSNVNMGREVLKGFEPLKLVPGIWRHICFPCIWF